MNSANEPPINDVFLNVRKAYRLLHDYQCMVRDAFRYIESQLDFSNLNINQRFAGSFSDGDYKLDKSSWVWLPMVFCEIRFHKSLEDAKWLHLSFFVISDTGFINGDVKENDKEKVRAFAPASKSSTKLAFILHDETPWENQLPAFMGDKVQMRKFIETGGCLPDDSVKRGFVGKCYDMSVLASERNADEVIEDVIALAKQNSWPLERKKKLQ